MEFIPQKYQAKDMKLGATFVSTDVGLQITLEPTQEVTDPHTHVTRRKEGTGCKLKFTGGAKVIENSKLLKLLMDSVAYKRGQVRINDSDPTGLWRQMGAVKTRTVEVVEFDNSRQPSFDDVNLKDLKAEDAIPLQKVV